MGQRLLLVRWHSGGGTEGKKFRLRPWILELALTHSVILITPDHRLEPEHDWAETIDDLKSFRLWVENKLPGVLGKQCNVVQIDLANVAVVGESAGGWSSDYSVLLPGLFSWSFEAVTLQYSPLDGVVRWPSLRASNRKYQSACWLITLRV